MSDPRTPKKTPPAATPARSLLAAHATPAGPVAASGPIGASLIGGTGERRPSRSRITPALRKALTPPIVAAVAPALERALTPPIVRALTPPLVPAPARPAGRAVPPSEYVTVQIARALGAWLRSQVFTREFAAWGLAWAFTFALALALCAFAVDLGLLLSANLPAQRAIAIAGVSAALGALFGIAATPAFLAVAMASRWLGGQRSRLQLLWPLPVALAAAVFSGAIIDAPFRRLAFVGIGLGVVVTSVALAWLVGSPRPSARAAALAIGLGALGADIAAPPSLYRDLHDLAAVIGILGVLASVAPLRLPLARQRPFALALGLAIVTLICAGGAAALAARVPGFRTVIGQRGRFAPSLARLFRSVADLDRDGFSPLAWGGDCDDLDPARNPLARETTPGEDRNCNGIRLPAHPSDGDRGLAPASGEPDLPAGTVRTVVLVTIECFRADALRADVTPRLARLSAEGLLFSRLYAAGSRTHQTLPLLTRLPTGAALPERLARAGVSSTAILGFFDEELATSLPDGWARLTTPGTLPSLTDRRRLDAPKLTDLAIADLAEHRGARHFLWLHYFDSHAHYQVGAGIPEFRPPAGRSPSYGRYLASLATIDRELGRLLDALDTAGEREATMVIVTGDHGEAFGTHRIEFHGTSGFDDVLRVPGILRAPGAPIGAYSRPASQRDVPPTVLGAFGLVGADPVVEQFGRSWHRLRAHRDAPLHRFVISRSSGASGTGGFVLPLGVLVDDSHKLVKSFETGLVELYDLVEDPAEERNLEADEPATARRLEQELELYRDLDGYP